MRDPPDGRAAVRGPRKGVRWLVPTIGGTLATKKQQARAAAAGKELPGKPKKKTSRGK